MGAGYRQIPDMRLALWLTVSSEFPVPCSRSLFPVPLSRLPFTVHHSPFTSVYIGVQILESRIDGQRHHLLARPQPLRHLNRGEDVGA